MYVCMYVCMYVELTELQPSSDGDVVCRQLGYLRALRVTTDLSYGQGAGPAWLSLVQCSGGEEEIAECPHGGWAAQTCAGSDAGVVCTSEWQREVCSQWVSGFSSQTTQSFPFVWWVGPRARRDGWRFSMNRPGAPSVTTLGISTMQLWCVVTWGSREPCRLHGRQPLVVPITPHPYGWRWVAMG